MPTKQSSSKKTMRSERTPKKGAVRTHNKRPSSTQGDTGLLDDLYRRSYRQTTPQSKNQRPTYEDNLAAATTLVCNELGARVAKIAKDEDWQSAVRPLVVEYIKSLVYGDGSQPQMLESSCATRINMIFVEVASRYIVGNDVLPGQRLDWYLPTLSDYRERRKAQTTSSHVTPRQFAEQLKRAS